MLQFQRYRFYLDTILLTVEDFLFPHIYWTGKNPLEAEHHIEVTICIACHLGCIQIHYE